jgi:hypothetical protein
MQVGQNRPALDGAELGNLVFVKSLAWFPWYFILTMAAMLLFSRWKLRGSREHKKPD